MGENFIASTDVTAILDKNYNKFINMFDIVKAKCEAIIDQTTPNMIQGLKGIFARKPLISKGI